MSRAGQIDLAAEMERVATEMRDQANLGVWDGRESTTNGPYFRACRRVDDTTRTVLLFTRDTGHHSSGWWKNPEFERCFHLSLSPAPSLILVPGRPPRAELDAKTERAWVLAFFREHADKVWAEPPATPRGRQLRVWHYRVFANEAWEPIVPRGEVYSKTLTEAGWLSFSDRRAQLDAAAARAKAEQDRRRR